MYVAFVNFNGDFVENLNLALHKEQLTGGSEQSFLQREGPTSPTQSDISRKENYQLKIYELYFVKSVSMHFEKLFKVLIKEEEMHLSYIKFKNMYVIDMSTSDIIFDLLSVRVTKAIK